jgi:predicted fused transcriptional regulator/phosphomethylpyrimidine kinase
MTVPAEERRVVLARIDEAAKLLDGSIDICLIPPDGGNIGYAITGARTGRDVAAITGGFQAGRGSVNCAGPVAFGAEERISRIILTAMKFDPEIRSAAVIRFSDDAFGILSAMFIDCAEVYPAKFPRGISTIDWAVASCCSGGVPDVIALHRATAAESLLCISGEDPVSIARNIIIVSNRIQ